MPPAKKRPAKKSDTLPGGYTVGEKVFFTGANQTFDDGDKLVHGQQGEVVGPATSEQAKGEGVDVLFPGNKGNIKCFFHEVRRLRAAPAATPPPAPPTRDAACVRTPRVGRPPSTRSQLQATAAAAALERGQAYPHPLLLVNACR
jgi:hypothetical protein